MIIRAAVICIVSVLLTSTAAIAGEAPLPQGKDNSSGISEIPTKRIRLQEYSNNIPQYGNYYEWDGGKWQRYASDIPQLGSYLKEVKPEERSPASRETTVHDGVK